MNKPRLRIFAGPNGSGKSTLAMGLKNHQDQRIKLGIFVNADEIEKELKHQGFISIDPFEIESNHQELDAYLRHHGIAPNWRNNLTFVKFDAPGHCIQVNGEIDSYVAADIAGYIRKCLLNRRKSFSFETVFSHPSKLEIIRIARESGYRVYLYFVTTQDPEININRVTLRVAKKGHPVARDKIIERYYKSLELLRSAIKLSNRAYLFDNSGKYFELIAEVTDGKSVEVLDFDQHIPQWFLDYVYSPNF